MNAEPWALEFGWTDSRVKKLKELWIEEGCSASQIARVLGNNLTRSSVLGKIHRLGIIHNPGVAKPRRTRSNPRSNPKPLPLPQPTPEPVIGTPRVPMLELQHSHCRFPMWAHEETGAPNFEHCGLQKVPHSSYCADHTRKAWQRGSKPDPVSKTELREAAESAVRVTGINRVFG